MESRVAIERDDEVPSVDRKLLDRGDVLHSGIVDEDIHTAKACSRFRHHRLDRVDFRQIGVAVDRARAANRLQPGAFRLYGIGIAKAVDDDVGALGGQCFRVTQPDPRCGPSGKRRLALQHHAFSSLECSCPLKPSSCASASRFAPGGTSRHRWLSLALRSEEHTSELQSLMRISYAVFCLKKKK